MINSDEENMPGGEVIGEMTVPLHMMCAMQEAGTHPT